MRVKLFMLAILFSAILFGCTGPAEELTQDDLDFEAELWARDEGINIAEATNLVGQAYSTDTLAAAGGTIWLYCYDSDGGLEPYVYGYAFGIYERKGKQYNVTQYDYCLDSQRLVSYMCGPSNPNRVAPRKFKCPMGCADGVCTNQTTNSCSDTDGGDVPATKGTVSGVISGTPYSSTDSCRGADLLTEYYCSGNYHNMKYYNCTAQGKVCEDGACKPGTPTNLTVNSCNDTDGGIVYGATGTVFGTYNNVPYSHTDYCLDIKNLKEYYCEDMVWREQVYDCSENGTYVTNCSSGKCQYGGGGGGGGSVNTTFCTDTDGGKNYDVKGYVNLPGYGWDYCAADGRLMENFCYEQGYPGTVAYDCPFGCSDGACNAYNTTYTCSDTDGGRNYPVKGNVTTCVYSSGSGGGSAGCGFAMDFCTSSTQLTEHFCENDRGKSESVPCLYGCEDGACLSENTTIYTCSDTDGGRNYPVKGNVTTCVYSSGSGGGSAGCGFAMDFCPSSYQLTEYFCEDDRGKSESVPCMDGCYDGACNNATGGGNSTY